MLPLKIWLGIHDVVTITWFTLTVIVLTSCVISFVTPYWFLHPDNVHAFGMIRYCVWDYMNREPVAKCQLYGDKFALGFIPSDAWRVACLSYGAGLVCLTVSLFASITMLLYNRYYNSIPSEAIVVLCFYTSILSVLLLVIGMLFYPVGLQSDFFQYYCGEDAGAYQPGRCDIGWSFMLGIMGTSLSVFSPVLLKLVVQFKMLAPEDDYRIQLL